jgi:hypothetical protein
MTAQRYIFRWNRVGRKGQICTITARGSLNSCRVVFEDGHVMITSRNALRRAPETGPDAMQNAKRKNRHPASPKTTDATS